MGTLNVQGARHINLAKSHEIWEGRRAIYCEQYEESGMESIILLSIPLYSYITRCQSWCFKLEANEIPNTICTRYT